MSVYNDVIITPFMRERGWIPGEAARPGVGGGAGGAEGQGEGGHSDDSSGAGSDLGGADDRPLLTDAEPLAVSDGEPDGPERRS